MDPTMDDQRVREILAIEPFCSMDDQQFPPKTPLQGILKNDCRWRDVQPGEIIIREGDFGNTAFLVIQGSVLISIQRLAASVLGRSEVKQKGILSAFSQLWKNPQVAEVRESAAKLDKTLTTNVDAKGQTHICVQDIPRLIEPGKSIELSRGEMFGELGAMTRAPRSATVIAKDRCLLLEIRWQGLRDILKYDPTLRDHVDELYRKNSLQVQLRNTPLLKDLDEHAIQQIAERTIFQSTGNFDWHHQFKQIQKTDDAATKIHQEPLVVAEGDYVNGLILIRNGFARISKSHGDGHRTIAYLGGGQVFGLRELYHNWKNNDQTPYLLSMRAIGYVDTLTIPTEIVEQYILPTIAKRQIPTPLQPDTSSRERRAQTRQSDLDQGLLEFLVEGRLINGTQAMLIDRDRCTRCDDCVRACATAHDGNPRFVRSGPVHDNWMVAQSCMHCMDPVCMIGCPTGAIGRDEQSGVVHINDQTCIGCSTCSNSCPYQNIQMVPIRNSDHTPMVGEQDQLPIVKATKCDLCMEQMGGPACQRACPHDALVRIDLTTDEQLKKFLKI